VKNRIKLQKRLGKRGWLKSVRSTLKKALKGNSNAKIDIIAAE
jgi:hypothetical protein